MLYPKKVGHNLFQITLPPEYATYKYPFFFDDKWSLEYGEPTAERLHHQRPDKRWFKLDLTIKKMLELTNRHGLKIEKNVWVNMDCKLNELPRNTTLSSKMDKLPDGSVQISAFLKQAKNPTFIQLPPIIESIPRKANKAPQTDKVAAKLIKQSPPSDQFTVKPIKQATQTERVKIRKTTFRQVIRDAAKQANEIKGTSSAMATELHSDGIGKTDGKTEAPELRIIQKKRPKTHFRKTQKPGRV